MGSFCKIHVTLTTYLVINVLSSAFAAPLVADPLWTCPSSPVNCVPTAPGIEPKNLCSNDTDCSGGDQCCYLGCIKRCISPQPCDRVRCEPGYACREEMTLCDQPPCALQATCIPEAEARCPTRNCNTRVCPAGFERRTDRQGCPLCNCVPKKNCGGGCRVLCAYGNVMKDGCPTCECEKEPAGPCSNVTCDEGQECRLVQVDCTEYPCLPEPTCVPVAQRRSDITCGLLSKTLSGRPVLAQDDQLQEVNCSVHKCPDHTVCSAMEEGIHVCCWQHTQSSVTGPPKVGQCPPLYLVDFSRPMVQCEIDDDCPDVQKCCYRNKSKGKGRYFGMCLLPEHEKLGQSNVCERSAFVKAMLSWFNIC